VCITDAFQPGKHFVQLPANYRCISTTASSKLRHLSWYFTLSEFLVAMYTDRSTTSERVHHARFLCHHCLIDSFQDVTANAVSHTLSRSVDCSGGKNRRRCALLSVPVRRRYGTNPSYRPRQQRVYQTSCSNGKYPDGGVWSAVTESLDTVSHPTLKPHNASEAACASIFG
jgi:hypothetical protein